MCIHFITREKGDEIIENQLNIINRIKRLNNEYSSITDELTRANNLLRTINTKSNSSQNPQQDNSVRTDKIEGRLGEVRISLQEEYKSNLSQDQQSIRERLVEIEDRLEEIKRNLDDNKTFLQEKFQSNVKKTDKIDTSVIGDSLLKLKEAPLDMTGIIPIVLILIISALTALPFFFPNQMDVVYKTEQSKTSIHLGIILIFLALAGVWSLVFMYIKSRIKTHEQDSTLLRKFLHEN